MTRYDRSDGTPSESPKRAVKQNNHPGHDPAHPIEAPSEMTGLPYISKSRVKTYKTCPAKFFYKYWGGVRTPPSYHTEKGSRLHEAFETFHLNLLDYVEEHGERPEMFVDLMPHWSLYTQWVEQFGNFTLFEERRWKAAYDALSGLAVLDLPTREDHLDVWLPVEVEAEAWLGTPPASWVEEHGEPEYVSGSPPVGDAPWMGRADLIARTQSVPGVDGDGVVIIDYKTGKVPKEQYREEGIFLEGEYYGWLFEEFFDVDAVAGYYPAHDEFIVSPYPNQDRRRDIKRAVLGMQKVPELADDVVPANFPRDEGPLCHYGHGACFFYDYCSPGWTPR